jgi:homoserine kinase type II
MSVYTPVTAPDLDAWLTRYAVGALAELQPIASGIENTNYFVTTERGRYVLTLYERLPARELPFYLNLMAHLARAGVEVPAPVPDRTGAYFSLLNGKPAGLVARVDGVPVATPLQAHCAHVGDALARLHVASQTYRARLTNRRGPAWWRQAARAVKPHLDRRARRRCSTARSSFRPASVVASCPRARSMAIFFATTCSLPAIAWRASSILASPPPTSSPTTLPSPSTTGARETPTAVLTPPTLTAMVSAYDAARPLTQDEREAWPALLRAAALRFWLSRLYDLHLPRSGELTHAHDPAYFERILRDRATNPVRFPLAGAAAS